MRTAAGPIDTSQCVQRRPVGWLVACSAGPGGVPAAVPEAGDMAHEDLVRAEGVSVRAATGRLSRPSACGCMHKSALHLYQAIEAR
jgi:hypothetical protein